MKITKVEPIFVAIPYEHGAPKPRRSGGAIWDTQSILFVRVETDDGIVGWGEAFSFAGVPVTMQAVSRAVAPLAVGSDPSNIGALMNDLRRRCQSISRGGPIAFALSALDIALWDIAGKAAGKPVWQLLGGAGKDSVPVYASLHRIDHADLVARVTATAVERGYRHVKLHEHDIAMVSAARRAAGADIALMVDTNCHWSSAAEVVAIGEQMRPYDIAWLEEPLDPPDDYDVLASIRRDLRIPIAAGENLGNFNDARWMIAAGAVDIIQPSVAKIGGITQLWKIISHAQSAGVRAVPHAPFVGPALAAVVHVIAVLPGDVLCEHRYCDLAASPIGDWVVQRNGRLSVPKGPGLGFDVDPAVMARYAVN